MQPAESAAHRILAILEATYQPTHRIVAAHAAEFGHLDLAWYDKTARLLATNGFRPLADVEDKTITETPGTVLSAILVRTLLSRDGTVMASLYHPHIRKVWLRLLLWVLRKLPKNVTDMETEFTDGTFVATSSAESAAALSTGEMIDAEFLPATTPPLEVHRRHLARIAAHVAARPGVTARVIQSHEEMVASQNRMNALKAAYRGEIGAITKDELDRLSILGRGIAGDVHRAIVSEQVRRAG